MTVPAIAPQARTDETLKTGRQAHERNSIDGTFARARAPASDKRRIREGTDLKKNLGDATRGDTGFTWRWEAAFRRLTYRGRAATPMPL